MGTNFTLDISKFIEKAQGNIDKTVRQVVGLIAQELDQRTPRDTGRLAANWQFGAYSAPSSTIDSVELNVGGMAQRIQAEASSLTAGGECWIVNNLPYAGRIEYGYSAKQPAGMVRVTLASLPANIERFVRNLP